jgi:hypothetical protein
MKSPLVLVILAALVGGGVAIALDRLVLNEPSPAPAAPPTAVATEPPAPPALAADPGPARTLVVETLIAAQVSHAAIKHGLYPLRGPGRAPSETLNLISFTCPTGGGCSPLLAALDTRARATGYTMIGPMGGDRPSRPLHRALALGPQPALALRAMPPGPRLSLIIDDVGRESALLDAMLALDPHVAFAVLPGSPAAPAAIERLTAASRELLVQIPLADPGEASPVPGPITASLDADATSQRVDELLTAVPGAVGALTHGGASITASRLHLNAMLGALQSRGQFYLDAQPSTVSLAGPMAKALGVRTATRTHRLDTGHGDLQGRFKAVEAALVLEGSAVVVTRPTPEVLVALRPWLSGLRGRGIHLLRLSEIVL